ncbi:zinc-finger-containing protein [uncultured Pleomorphomonas sp.]|nr:zinc-finger-containing protein [uncultured Pleomorphomonas sp.]
MADTRSIYCCGCGRGVDARLTNGFEIYRHRPDLYQLPFWKCDACGNYVGCHHKTTTPTKPLGVIPTAAIKAERQKIHRLVDPLWQSGKWRRGHLYAEISRRIGKQYHTAEIRSVAEAHEILEAVKAIADGAANG